MDIRIYKLYFYPLKGGAYIALDSAVVTPRGLAVGEITDRSWMLVDANGKFVSQRTHATLATITPIIVNDGRSLRFYGNGYVSPDIDESVLSDKEIDVTVWSDKIKGQVAQDHINEWFSDYLRSNVRLVYQRPEHIRLCDPTFIDRMDEHTVSYADGYPYLIVNQDTLDKINERLSRKVPITQFRPNIVLTGCGKDFEYRQKRLIFRDASFDLVKPCTRCGVTKISQEDGTLEAYPHHMKILAEEYFIRLKNRNGGFDQDGVFGMNAIGSHGVVRLADQLLSEEPQPTAWIFGKHHYLPTPKSP